MSKSTLSLLLLLGLVSGCQAADLEISIKFNKRVYRVGDKLESALRFTNNSLHPIRFLPRETVFPAAELQFKSRDTTEEAKLIPLSDSLDIEALAKQVITVAPGETFVRKLRADVRSDFRPIYHDPRHGLILDFPGSALLLPGFGHYTVTKVFQEHSADSVVGYLQKGPRFWDGGIASSPVDVEFRPK